MTASRPRSELTGVRTNSIDRPFGAQAVLLADSSPGLSNRGCRDLTEMTATRVFRTAN